MFVPPPLLTPHFYFPLELYVYLTLTNNYLAFFIYQLIILWIISINWHRWLLVNNHISKNNTFILVLYRRYINYMSVCPPPPPPTLFGTFLRHWYIYTHIHIHTYVYIVVSVRTTIQCNKVFNKHLQSKLLYRMFTTGASSDLCQPFRPRQKSWGLGWEERRV